MQVGTRPPSRGDGEGSIGGGVAHRTQMHREAIHQVPEAWEQSRRWGLGAHLGFSQGGQSRLVGREAKEI